MRKRHYSEREIVYAAREVGAGVRIAEVCRKYGISQATLNRWSRKCPGLGASEIARLHHDERLTPL